MISFQVLLKGSPATNERHRTFAASIKLSGASVIPTVAVCPRLARAQNCGLVAEKRRLPRNDHFEAAPNDEGRRKTRHKKRPGISAGPPRYTSNANSGQATCISAPFRRRLRRMAM